MGFYIFEGSYNPFGTAKLAPLPGSGNYNYHGKRRHLLFAFMH